MFCAPITGSIGFGLHDGLNRRTCIRCPYTAPGLRAVSSWFGVSDSGVGRLGIRARAGKPVPDAFIGPIESLKVGGFRKRFPCATPFASQYLAVLHII